MSLETLRTAVVETIQTAITPDIHCAPHGGRFDAAELKRVVTRAPAVFVAILGFRELAYANGEYSAMVQWGAFVVAKDRPGVNRALVAGALVDRLALVVPDNTWGTDDCVSTPQAIRGDNLFTSSEKMGVAMWAVTWQQEMQLGQAMTAEELATLDPFTTLYARYPVADDAPVAEDTLTLPQDQED